MARPWGELAQHLVPSPTVVMFESLQKSWNETMQITEARWVVWLTLLLVLVVTGVYLVKLFRDFAFGLRPSEADRINDLRNLKEIGALSEAEYRRAREALSQGVIDAKVPDGSKEPDGQPGVAPSIAFREVVDREGASEVGEARNP